MKNSITLLLTVLESHKHRGKKPSFTLLGVCTQKEARAKCDNCDTQFGAL